MEVIEVDIEKCVKCGACSEVCPVKVIGKTKEGIPMPLKWALDACIDCGHCVCACPTGAMSQRNMTSSECSKIEEELNITQKQIEQSVKARRSIRVYKDEPVDKKVLKKLVEVVRYSPTGHNTQTVKWKIFHEKEKVKELKCQVLDWMKQAVKDEHPLSKTLNMRSLLIAGKRGMDPILRDAPHLIHTYVHSNDRIGPKSATIALTTLGLVAPSFGLGTCWAGFLDLAIMNWPPLKEALGLEQDHVGSGSMIIGYPKYKYYKMPLRKEIEVLWK